MVHDVSHIFGICDDFCPERLSCCSPLKHLSKPYHTAIVVVYA